jgi:hypothetical protein
VAADTPHKNMLSVLGVEDSILRGGVGAVPDLWKLINVQEDLAKAQLRNAVQADIVNANVLGAQAQNFPPNVSSIGQFPTNGPITTKPPPGSTLPERAREMFLKRMGGIRAELRIADSDFLQCHIYGEVVHLFYCFGGRAGVTQESIDMFPSDTLITQFRMVLST